VDILFDTNVLIDAAVPDRTYHREALQLIDLVRKEKIRGLVAPASLTTVWYITSVRYEVDSRPLIRSIEETFDLAPMTRPALRQALNSPESADFEDVYLAAAGAESGATSVVTRNQIDFVETPLEPYHPVSLIKTLTR
jgi:predicted nucleic acid-binding protein